MDDSKYLSSYSLDFDNVDDNNEVIRRNVILLNSDVIPGAPYFTCTWFYKSTGLMQKTHTHDFDEHVGFVGSNPDDPTDLGGIIKFMVDGEWLTIDRSAVLFIPAGVAHCPYIIERLDRPIIHWSSGATGSYSQGKDTQQ